MAIDLDAAIHDAEAQLAELDRLREAAVLRLAELTQRRAARDRSEGPGANLSPIAKARLFGDLFRGRDDVFAVRWENLAKGRSGYSPRCVPVLRRMYAKRLRAYADMGYETNDSSPSNSIPHPSDRLAVSGGL